METVPSVHSPAEARIREMQARGECVTSPLHRQVQVVPVSVPILVDVGLVAPLGAKIPPPWDESMPDG